MGIMGWLYTNHRIWQFNQFRMPAHKQQISFILQKLNQINNKLGAITPKKTAHSEFDFLQEEFLARRHRVQVLQDLLQKDGGFNVANANAGYSIREGIVQMRQLILKLKQEYRRLIKKKRYTAQIMEMKRKIVENCQFLLADIQERQNYDVPHNTKPITLTDLKAQHLHQIDQNDDSIHQKTSYENKLTENHIEDKLQTDKWQQVDQKIDIMIDGVITCVQTLKQKAKQMNDAQDIIADKTHNAQHKIEKLQPRILGDNQKLKKLIQEFKPSRCCLYLVLVFMLIGLAVCAVKLLA